MLEISRDTREEIEKEFMALVLNKNELLDIIQIKPKFLSITQNQKILKYSLECYKESGMVNIADIYKKHKDIDLGYFAYLLLDVLWYPNNWKEQLKISQDCILKYYKEDYIEHLNNQLKEKNIEYDDFIKKMKEIEDYQIQDEIKELSKSEIKETISEEKSRINFNKFKKLDNTLKLVQGDFLIIGATTGAGKSGLMLNLMEDLMNTFQCIYFNMEMSKSTIYKRIVSINADVKVNDIEHPKSEYQKNLIEKAMDNIEKAKLIIEHKASDINTIKSTIAKMKDKDKHTIVFVDHLGLVKIDGSRSLYEQATEVAKELRQICLEYDCTIISASQLNRGAYSSDEITLSMLKDSGELENSSSKVLLLYKDKEANKDDLVQKMIFDIAKNRDGVTGLIEAVYDKEKQIFKERNKFY